MEMKLIEIVGELASFDSENTIYCVRALDCRTNGST